jgi:hypothetical protein
MSFTTSITGASTAISTVTLSTSYTTSDGKVSPEKIGHIAATTVATGATAIGQSIANDHNMDKIYEKYSSATTAYAESLSDDELDAAIRLLSNDDELAIMLQDADLLPAEQAENTDVKTI